METFNASIEVNGCNFQ